MEDINILAFDLGHADYTSSISVLREIHAMVEDEKLEEALRIAKEGCDNVEESSGDEGTNMISELLELLEEIVAGE